MCCTNEHWFEGAFRGSGKGRGAGLQLLGNARCEFCARGDYERYVRLFIMLRSIDDNRDRVVVGPEGESGGGTSLAVVALLLPRW